MLAHEGDAINKSRLPRHQPHAPPLLLSPAPRPQHNPDLPLRFPVVTSRAQQNSDHFVKGVEVDSSRKVKSNHCRHRKCSSSRSSNNKLLLTITLSTSAVLTLALLTSQPIGVGACNGRYSDFCDSYEEEQEVSAAQDTSMVQAKATAEVAESQRRLLQQLLEAEQRGQRPTAKARGGGGGGGGGDGEEEMQRKTHGTEEELIFPSPLPFGARRKRLASDIDYDDFQRSQHPLSTPSSSSSFPPFPSLSSASTSHFSSSSSSSSSSSYHLLTQHGRRGRRRKHNRRTKARIIDGGDERGRRADYPGSDVAEIERTRRGAIDRIDANKISVILDTLFDSKKYDRQIRPQLGLEPLDVEVNIAIRSMGPVDERKQVFSMDCYFRQSWTDPRLRYNVTKKMKKDDFKLAMNWQFLNKIWRPDTFFFNGMQSYLHKMTVPNRFIRISPEGRISYSQRLTIKARCEMDLRKFPLDKQNCPLDIGSFGHDAEDIRYTWSAKPLSMDPFDLAQYSLVNWTHGSFEGPMRDRNVSKVFLNFQFQRQQGFYLLQIYIPLTLIVCCSWVTFWLRKTEKGSEIPARTSLGASSVLSVVTIGFSGKSKPQVGYATALDVFIIICFANVFAALIEFAFLNFLDTLVRRLKRKDKDSKLVMLMATHNVMHGRMPLIPKRQESTMDTDGILTDDDLLTPPDSNSPAREMPFHFNGVPADLLAALHEMEDRDCWTRFVDAVLDCLQALNCCRSIRETEMFTHPQVVFNRVDGCSRKLFPITFLLLNVAYWYGYWYWF